MEKLNVKIIGALTMVLLYVLIILKNRRSIKSKSIMLLEELWVFSLVSTSIFLIIFLLYSEKTLWVVITFIFAVTANTAFWFLRTNDGEKKRDIIMVVALFAAACIFYFLKH